MSPGEGVQTGAPEILWRFTTRDRRWSVILGETAITLEVSGYSSFDEFGDRFAHVLGLAQETLGISERTRLGLRYTNQIRHPRGRTLADWAALLRPDFVGFAASDLLDGSVEESRQELRVHRPDGVLVIRHGLTSQTINEPVAVEDRFYLIDLDYFDSTECDLDVVATKRAMLAYNEFVYRFFRWTLSDELYAHLEPVDAAE